MNHLIDFIKCCLLEWTYDLAVRSLYLSSEFLDLQPVLAPSFFLMQSLGVTGDGSSQQLLACPAPTSAPAFAGR